VVWSYGLVAKETTGGRFPVFHHKVARLLRGLGTVWNNEDANGHPSAKDDPQDRKSRVVYRLPPRATRKTLFTYLLPIVQVQPGGDRLGGP
jgi:hypothetical protein